MIGCASAYGAGEAQDAAVARAPHSKHQSVGALGELTAACDWAELFQLLVQMNCSTFVTGGPGLGESALL